MSCAVHSEDISALLDSELDAIAERRLRDHLAVCAGCRREFARMRRLRGALATWDAGNTPPRAPAFVDRVVSAAVAPGGGRIVHLPVFAPLAAAAALLVVIGLSVAWLVSASTGPDLPRAGDPAASAYRARAAELEPDDGAGHLALARWCEEAGLGDLATREYLRALGADPSLGRARDALADLLPGRVDPGEPLRVELPPLPDLGPDLPGPRMRAPTREELLAWLGLSRSGDRWLTADARRRLRERREGEELLARSAERAGGSRAPAPPPSATDPVVTFLASLEFATPETSDRLSVVALLDGEGDAGVTVLGAEEAFAAGLLTISEDLTEGRLAAENRDPKRYVFLAAGQILRGGQQDRMLIRDVLLPPKTGDRIPVVCCERERWTGPTLDFGASPGIAPPGVRRLLLGGEDQRAIWDRIAVQLAALDAPSATQALRAAYGRGRGPRLMRAAERALGPLFENERTVGFLAFADGEFLGGEIFADHALFRTFGLRYLGTYALEAAVRSTGAGAATAVEPRALIDSIARAAFYRSGGAGSGQETEFVGGAGGVDGHALVPVADARPIHVSLFPGRGREEATRDGAPPPAPATPTGAADAEDPAPPSLPEPHSGQERRVEERRNGRNGLGGKTIEPPKRDDPPARKIPGEIKNPGSSGGRPIERAPDRPRPRDRDTITPPKR